MPRGRKALAFWAVSLATPFLLLLAVELTLRALGVAYPDDPFLNLGRRTTFFSPFRESDGTLTYRVTHQNMYPGRNTAFAAVKPADTFRIFCFGGSASAGWPHPPGENYAAYLQQALQHALPEQRVEVINLSGHAFPSFRVRLIVHDALAFEPDLIVVYTGNNEFLEARTYLDQTARGKLLSAASRLVLVQALRRGLMSIVYPENSLSADHREDVEWQEWSKIERRTLALRADPEQFERLQAHYRFSLESMAVEASARGVPMVLLTIPVNLRDWHPNVSRRIRDAAKRARLEGSLVAARRALAGEDPGQAIAALLEALSIDSGHAESHFLLGRALEARGEFAKAYAEYDLARDLDYNPFRAISVFDTAVREIADERSEVHLADAVAAFRAASAPRAPGFDLFLDYVHPTKRGNLLIAQTVFDVICGTSMLGEVSVGFTHEPIPITPAGDLYDERRHLRMQGVLVRLFGMMHQYEATLERARAIARTPGARLLVNAEDWRLLEDALRVFPPLVSAQRGEGSPPHDRRVQEAVARFYRAHYPGYEGFRERYEETESEWQSDPAQ